MYSEKNQKALDAFVYNFSIHPFDSNAALEYGKIRANLEKIGRPIGGMDMLIVAHAKSQKLILVTNNTKEFIRVNGLNIEDWKK